MWWSGGFVISVFVCVWFVCGKSHDVGSPLPELSIGAFGSVPEPCIVDHNDGPEAAEGAEGHTARSKHHTAAQHLVEKKRVGKKG